MDKLQIDGLNCLEPYLSSLENGFRIKNRIVVNKVENCIQFSNSPEEFSSLIT